MATDNNFGEGVFDDSDESEPITLTEREIAIASGEELPESISVHSDSDTDPDEDTDVEPEPNDPPAEKPESKAPTFSDSDRELADLYGIEFDQLESPSSLLAAVNVLKKAGYVPGKGLVGGSPEDQRSDASVDDGGAVGEDDKETDKLDLLDASQFDDEDNPFDPATKDMANAIVSSQKALQAAMAKIEQLEAKIGEVEAKPEADAGIQQFNDTLDAMPEVFGELTVNGKAAKLTDEQQAARDEVKEAAKTIYLGLEASGRELPDLETIVKQAVRMLHGNVTESEGSTPAAGNRLAQQSAKRRSTGAKAGASQRQADSQDSDPDSTEAIANHPAMKKLWRQISESNGTV